MASSSSTYQTKEESSRFSGNESSKEIRGVDKSRKVYDVFINHRGPDVKYTLARQLYNSLRLGDLQVFLDSEEKEIGRSFPSTIENAIRSATVHIAIFSTRYAESSWCLDELVQMLDTKALIIPVFYDKLKPSDVRYAESKDGAYGAAFLRHRSEGRHSETKIDAWKRALHEVSLRAGFEVEKPEPIKPEKFINQCESIAKEVKEEVKRKEPLYVADQPVGLDELVKDFERFYQERKEKGQVNIVAISGIGGIGKSTLARELFNRKRSEYAEACFLSNVRENSEKGDLSSLQCKLLKDLLREDHSKFASTEDGIGQIKKSWGKVDKSLHFLVVLDDVNHWDQIEAFPILENLGNSLAIVTTREKGVLTSARISVTYTLGAMSPEYRRQLFCWHAFRLSSPVAGYEEVVEAFTDACRGLPLYLRVLGKHIVDKNVNDCWSALNKYKSMLHGDISKSLKISVQPLDKEVKMLFMDLACLFADKSISTAMKVLERCVSNARHALNTLKDKGLVEEIKGRLDQKVELTMHDLLRDLGREMAEEELTRRPWRQQNLTELAQRGFREILRLSNFRCFQSFLDISLHAQITYFLADSDSFFERSSSLLWLELDLKGCKYESIPPWIPLQNLQYLKINQGNLQRLWQSDQVPSSLKELHISQTTSVEGIDLLARPNQLERITVSVDDVTIEGWSFLESVIFNPKCLVLGSSEFNVETVSNTGPPPVPSQPISLSLSNVKLKGVLNLDNRGQPLTVGCPMVSLEKLEIFNQHLVTRVLVSGCHYRNIKFLVLKSMEGLIELELKMVTSLKILELTDCKALKIVSGLSSFPNFVTLNINGCSELEELQCLADLPVLRTVKIVRCEKLNRLELHRCENLKSVILTFMKNLVSVDLKRITALNSLQLTDCQNCKSVSGISGLPNLVTLSINRCSELEELPCFADMPVLQTVRIVRCEKLNHLELHRCENLNSVILYFLKNLVSVDLKRVTALNHLQLYDCQNCKTVSGVSDLANLAILIIHECRELEKLPRLSDLNMLEIVTIAGCAKLHRLELHRCENLKSVYLSSLESLHTVDLKTLTKLSSLWLNDSQNCKSVSGISDLANLVTLYINKFSELEEFPCLADLTVLQTVTIASCEKLNRLELHRCENLKSVVLSFMKSLVTLDLKSVTGLNSLELNDCQSFKSVLGISDLASLVTLSIKQCPELEELPCLDHLSCLRMITVGNWEKLNGLESVNVDHMTPERLALGSSKLSVELASYGSGKAGTFNCSPSLKYNLSNVRLRGILDLNNRGQPLTVGCPMGTLRKLEIFDEHLVPKVLVSGYDYPHIKSLVLRSMEGPIELELKMVTSLHTLELTNCKTLKIVSGISGVPNLVTLNINRCPELEELPCLANLNCLQKITIGRCEKLNRLEFHNCENLKSAVLSYMENLLTVDLRSINALNSLQLNDCQNCTSVSGISDLENLVALNIYQCPELQLPSLADMSCLQTVRICECEKLNSLEFAGCKSLETVKMQCTPNLEVFSIRHCPKLEKSLHLVGLSCLQRIIIDECGKPKCLRLCSLNTLKSLKVTVDLKELEIIKCPELEELPNLACLENLTIQMQDIAATEELPALKTLQILQCSSAVTQNLTHRLQRLPSDYMVVIGSAVDDAKSTLGSHLFSSWIGDDAAFEINVQENDFEDKLKLIREQSFLSAIIICTVVGIHSRTVTEFEQMGPSTGPYHRLGRGEWIAIAVINNQELITQYLEDFKLPSLRNLLRLSTSLDLSKMEKVCMVTVKKGKESKTLPLVKMIMDRLLKK